MSEDQEKKPVPQTPSSQPASATRVPQNPPAPGGPLATTAPVASAAKGPLLSRRAFLLGAVGVSTVLAAGALAVSLTPQGGILGPLVPPKLPAQNIVRFADLESQYQTAVANGQLYNPSAYSQFFYWPYSPSQSPYYKNVIVRLPDVAGPNPHYAGDPILSKFVAYNTTCVHLRCLVNPGYSSNSNQFRLLCPCHGSQYELATGIPKAGPAYDLGLNPLPIIILKVVGDQIQATELFGEPGIGRPQ